MASDIFLHDSRFRNRWQRISWDQALEEIAEKLTNIKDKYGPEAFGVMHGTAPRPSMYSTRLLGAAFGTPNAISVDFHICHNPSSVAQAVTWGPSILRESGPDHANSDCIMIIGGNPPISHPPRGVFIFEALKKRKSKLIVIDPRRTQLPRPTGA